MHSLLKNRKYIGEYKYASIVHPNAIPAIISPELFEKVQARMSRNKKAPASAKAEIEYILTTKLFCGHCGAFMVGESGTSRTGNIYYYYKCAKAKRRQGCKKKAIKKEFIERYVVAKTRELALNDKVIEQLADSVVEYQKLESPTLPLLRQELKNTETGIENMLDAVQKGIVTNATKNRLDKLESRKSDLEIAIAQEEIRRSVHTKEQIIFWLGKFKDGNIDDSKYRKYIVNIFVNSVYV